MTRQTRELLGVAVLCIAGFGLLLGITGNSRLTIARFLLFAGLGSALVVIIRDSVRGLMLRSVTGVSLWCILGFGMGFVPSWYLYRTYTGTPLFDSGASAPPQATEVAAAEMPEPTPTQEPTPTPEPTSEPTPTAEPVETATAPASCGQAVVTGVPALAVRDAPGLSTTVLGTRLGGSTVELLCDAAVDADGIQWRKVRTEGVEGWMSGRYLK